MRRHPLPALLLFCAIALGGCATPLVGVLYSDVQKGESVTSNQAGNRLGEACAISVLGLVASGDASTEAARRNGGITSITSVDTSYSSVLFFYAKYCTIVRGR